MKKIQFLTLFLTIPFIMYASKPRKKEIKYSDMPKTRESVERAIKASSEDCIDNVIGLLSELEREQNTRQAAQQSETACQLELKNLSNASDELKVVQRQRDECYDDAKKIETEKKQLTQSLNQCQASIETERKELQIIQTENEKLKRELTVEKEQANLSKKPFDQLQKALSDSDATVRDLRRDLEKNETLVDQKNREIIDLKGLHQHEKSEWEKEKSAWQKEKSTIIEQITQHPKESDECIKLKDRIKVLEDSLELANAKAKRIPSLEADIRELAPLAEKAKQIPQLEEHIKSLASQMENMKEHSSRELADQKQLKEAADKTIAELRATIEKMKKEQKRSLENELKEAHEKEKLTKNKALSETIKSQMELLQKDLTQLQKLMPAMTR